MRREERASRILERVERVEDSVFGRESERVRSEERVPTRSGGREIGGERWEAGMS